MQQDRGPALRTGPGLLRLFVVVATVGRPGILAKTIARLGRQLRLADGIVVASVTEQDVAGLERNLPATERIFSAKGLCNQRNNALRHLHGRADIILFLDDDFVAADDYLLEVERLFTERPDIVGATGHVIADGIKGAGFGFEQAVAIVESDTPAAERAVRKERALYGCNMAIRVDAAAGLRFDEALPLYGWLEDIDFTYRLGRRGMLVKSDRLRGVHMGAKGGRTSGLRLGYSQVANPVYMLRKGSAPPKLAYAMMTRNLSSNAIRSLAPEPQIDRIGRLRGNLLALWHLVRGRLDPRHILVLDQPPTASG